MVTVPLADEYRRVPKTQRRVWCRFSVAEPIKIFFLFRAVKVNASIYAIVVAGFNAMKYFNALNGTLLTTQTIPISNDGILAQRD